MGNGVQNVRFLRFLVVLGAVVLSIFIYASYYSSRSLAIPRIRNAASLMDVLKNNSNSDEINALVAKNSSNSDKSNIYESSNFTLGVNRKLTAQFVTVIALKHHREPTIDVGEPVDSDVDLALEERELKDHQYQPISDANSTLIHSQQHQEQVENNINKIPDSDVLIPTSNLQKFIDNADNILRNMTASSFAGKSIDNKYEKSVEETFTNASSVLIPVNNGINSISLGKLLDKKMSNISSNKLVTTNTTMALSTKHISTIDPTQGIPTKQLYESGHLNNEIDVLQICPKEGSDIKLLIIITSAQAHQEARLAIRQTWGHYGVRRDVATVFILGRSANVTLNTALSLENFLYGDLIRGQFIDSYNNLTLKTISALEWVNRHCSHAKYILKTDDDMFINVPKLLAFLDKHTNEKRVIYGRLAKKWKPIRNKKSKYYVSSSQFAATLFPPFTTGPAYVISSDIIHDLYQKSLQQTYLKLEDVFTTGIIAQQLGIKRVHVNEFLNRRIAFNPCNIRKTISVHMIKANEQFDLWKKLLDQTTKCK